MTTAVEKTVRYATSVDDLTAAWAVVMRYVDEVGPDPSISIKPYWRISAADPDGPAERRFEVVVSGMEPTEEEQ